MQHHVRFAPLDYDVLHGFREHKENIWAVSSVGLIAVKEHLMINSALDHGGSSRCQRLLHCFARDGM